jgi:hypothetical protein
MSRSRSAVLRVPAVLTFLIVHSSAVLADCRAEIDAAFQKLQMPGRAFRRVTTIDPIVPVIGPRGFASLVKPLSSFHPIGNGGSWSTLEAGLQILQMN